MNKYKGLLIDLDGTLYFKGKVFDGTLELLDTIKKNGIKIRYATNTAGTSPGKLVERIKNFGIPIEEDELLTPITVAKEYVENYKPDTYYVMASESIQNEFLQNNWNEENPEYVILGDIQEVCSYQEINKVFNFLKNGSQLFTTSYSPYFYSNEGHICIDTGSFTRMFEEGLQIKSTILGKPSSFFYAMAMSGMNLHSDNILAIGDDINTDVKGANESMIHSVLVQTGKYNKEEVDKSEIIPNYIISDFSRIMNIL